MASIYEDLVKAGVQIDNYRSDLYAPNTKEVRDILKRDPQQPVEPFAVQPSHPDRGQTWLRLPYAYLPFWEEVKST